MNSNVFKIEKLDHLGRGIVKINNKTTFVENALPMDIVKVSKKSEKKNYIIGKVDSFIESSPLRREFCTYSSICGGCDICNLKYYEQLAYKEDKIRNIVNKYLKGKVDINNILYNKDKEYRNKITLHICNNKLGFYKKESNNIVEIESCTLADNEINEAIKKIRFFLSNYDNDLKSVVIRTSSLKELMINFKGVVNEDDVANYFSFADSLSLNDKVLKKGYIKESIGSFEFLIYPNSFFQVNLFNTINLYNEVKRLTYGKKYNKILDLYCGTGTIGIILSDVSKKVIGIEIITDAIVAANKNKEINNIKNIDFICGRVEDNIDKFNDADLIVVDPPRSGLDNKTIDNILRIRPKEIIYVSCDPMTLVRDLNLLGSEYKSLELTPVDMFPNTHHVECVCLLKLR